jgi:dTMP kinase
MTTDPSDSSALIVLEGIDGSGTTTQAALLADALQARGHRAHLTRQPSTGPIGLVIREIIRGGHRLPDGDAPSEGTMALLFAADRSDHMEREVIPSLDAGWLVISARWTASAYAYQTAGLHPTVAYPHEQWLAELDLNSEKLPRPGFVPDCEIWLRCRPEVANTRRVAAGMRIDRYDDLAFQHELAAAYERVMSRGGRDGTTVEVDGEASVGEVHRRVLEVVLERLRSR